MTQAKKVNHRSRYKVPSLAGALLLLIVLGLILAHHKKSSPVIPSTNPLGNTQRPSSSNPSSPGNNSQSSQNDSAANTPAGGPPPITPYGNFVSNHHPSGDLTSESSTCNTSAGASCYIKFTKGSEVKQLDAQTTDGNGAAIWYWDIKKAGLSSGSWTVTAVATLNGQTKTASDSQQLVIE